MAKRIEYPQSFYRSRRWGHEDHGWLVQEEWEISIRAQHILVLLHFSQAADAITQPSSPKLLLLVDTWVHCVHRSATYVRFAKIIIWKIALLRLIDFELLLRLFARSKRTLIHTNRHLVARLSCYHTEVIWSRLGLSGTVDFTEVARADAAKILLVLTSMETSAVLCALRQAETSSGLSQPALFAIVSNLHVG